MFLIWKGDLSRHGDHCMLYGEKNDARQNKRTRKSYKSSDVAKKVGVKLHWCTQPAFETSSKINYWNQRSY